MNLIAISALVLLIGAALSILLRSNVQRVAASLLTQAIATVCVVMTTLPILAQPGTELRDVFTWSYPVDQIAVHLDALGAFFLVWSLPMVLLGSIYAVGYLRPSFGTRHVGAHFALLNLTALSFLMIYTLESAIVFLLGWEIAAVCAWLLVIWDYGNQKIRFAGFNYLVSTHLGLFFLVAALMVLHSQTGSMDFESFSTFLNTPSTLRDTTFLLLVIAFGLKSAFFPFHTWLPRAHSAAPAHVSALMSGVIHKAGLFGLLRFTLLIKNPEAWMGWTLIGFSALSAVVGALYSTSQRDLKRLLGYSSTENVGIAGMAFGVGTLGLCWQQPTLVALGFTGGILHILNHAIFKCLLFYAAGGVYQSTHTVDLERLGGLLRKLPWVGLCFLVGGLAIAGMPGLNGFTSEFLIFGSLLEPVPVGGLERTALVFAAAVLAMVGGISAFAVVRSFGLTFLGVPRDPAVHPKTPTHPAMLLTMGVHAAGILAIGLAPDLAFRLVAAPARLFTQLVPAAAPRAVDPVALLAPIANLAALLIVIVGGLVLLRGWLATRAPARTHVTWSCGYPAPTARIQYTGTSFTAPLSRLFAGVLPMLRREKLPVGPFPQSGDYLHTHSVDAVERRMFELIGNSDQLVTETAAKISEESRLSFGLGLLVLVIMIGLLFAGKLGLL
ncbi:MAG: hyfB [Myxococcaceae bacterium]|nr:hyfB [Myxococcaceae bacterium]